MARVLVTGGAGYVGSHCVKALAAAGHECVVYDSLLYGHREFVRWGPLVVGDIRDVELLDRTFAEGRFDAVMHFAALAYVGESMVEPSAYYEVNINGTRLVLDAMRRAGVSRIIFSSSCATYGQPASLPVTEAMPAAPMSPYGFSKYVCERLFADYGRAHGFRSACLRYFNAAGADPSALIGESHEPETHLIPLVLDAAMGRRPSIGVFGEDHGTPDGTCVRDYVHVSDLATAHLLAMEQLLAGGESLALNLGGGVGVSVREVIAAAERVTGRTIPVVMSARRDGDPPALFADIGRARAELGWQPKHSDLDTILTDAWRWHERRFGGQPQGQHRPIDD